MLYPLLGSMLALVIGGLLAFKADNKLGYMVMAAGIYYGVVTLKPVMRAPTQSASTRTIRP